uniref:uncharacterized protein LOC122585249 n=1 Tax=Erigeron canadensis TaxID=72917 RepID=UPI001CB9A1AA|nr:uncharacterized protein LOC122585249 [Erigeron canadensis]
MHPAVIIRNRDLHPCMLDTQEYFLFYCEVPNTIRDKTGYLHIQDQTNGLWEATCFSSTISCEFSDYTAQEGQLQHFSYKDVDQRTTNWRMVLYTIPESKMAICKVYETVDSTYVEGLGRVVKAKRDFKGSQKLVAAEAIKIDLLEVALAEAKNNHVRFRSDMESKFLLLGTEVRRLMKEVHKEANFIDPTYRAKKRKLGDIEKQAFLKERAHRAARKFKKVQKASNRKKVEIKAVKLVIERAQRSLEKKLQRVAGYRKMAKIKVVKLLKERAQ